MTEKRIITLTTDFGNEDYYVACMKGVILSINPDALIIDNTHNLDSFDIIKGAFNLLNFYRYYPEGTIHVAVVDPGVGSRRRCLLVAGDGYYFVGPDNGIFTYIIDNCRRVQIYSITNKDYFLPSISNTFHGRDIFAPVASHISLGRPLSSFGRKTSKYKRINIVKPIIRNKYLIGQIIYQDKYGNLITNIRTKYTSRISTITIDDILIPGLHKKYTDVKKGEILALTGSSGYLEISVNKGSAANIINHRSVIKCSLK